jgi:predicted  nucleic acid-binding Zn-ribbon protein
MDKTDTPRTDALMYSPLMRDILRGWKDSLIDHARTLERDLASSQERVKRLEGALQDAAKRIDQVAEEIHEHGSCTQRSVYVYRWAADARAALEPK